MKITVARWVFLLIPSIAFAGPSLKSLPVEIHISVCSGVSETVQKLGLTPTFDEHRTGWFFDNDELALLNQGLMIRARQKDGASHAQITVKLRPYDSARVSDHWFSDDDFKCETDDYGVSSDVGACSLNAKLKTKTLNQMVSNFDDSTLLSNDQRSFLSENLSPLPSFAGVRALGPIDVSDWDFKSTDGTHDLELEVWQVSGMDPVIEVSTRTSTGAAPQLRDVLTRMILDRGLNLCRRQDGKSRQTLEYLAKAGPRS